MSAAASPPGEGAPPRPVLQVSGRPTPEELAAVVAVLSRRGGAAPEEEPAAPSRWNERASLLRQPLRHGYGAWRAGLRSGR